MPQIKKKMISCNSKEQTKSQQIHIDILCISFRFFVFI